MVRYIVYIEEGIRITLVSRRQMKEIVFTEVVI